MLNLIDMHELPSNLISLDAYTEKYLDKSWEWLNDPEIKQLTLTPDFTREQQYDFFKNLKTREDYWIRGISFDAVPIGVVGLKNISCKNAEAEYWGYIGDKKYWGVGAGKTMMRMVLDEARRMGLSRIYLYVWKENRQAISFYVKSGFIYEGDVGDKLKYSMNLIS